MMSKEILAKTMFGEARGEYKNPNGGVNSLIAVGNVIINRSLQSGEEIEKVCLKPKQFSCWNETDPNYKILETIDINDPIYKICLELASQIIDGYQDDITNGSDHYYSVSMKKAPYWANLKIPTIKICHHIFFKLGYGKTNT